MVIWTFAVLKFTFFENVESCVSSFEKTESDKYSFCVGMLFFINLIFY